MAASIIDRRLAGKNKSVGNRERFLRRHKEQVREAVKRAIDGRGIRDVERGEDVHIPKKDMSEPVFGHGQGGMREVVHPGNKDFIRGDRIERPKGGGGQGSGKGQASDSGEGEDDFVFSLSKEEFMQVFFEDLALPQPGAHPTGRNARMEEPARRLQQRRHAEQPARGALDARRHRPAHRHRRRLAAPRCARWKKNSTNCWREPQDRRAAGSASRSWKPRSPRCARASRASPTWTRSTCATAAASACRCPPARR